MSKCPPAISGQGGHSTTFTVAVALVNGFAFDQEQALSLLREYNACCQPPWSEKDLQHKINSAVKTPHNKPRGHLLEDINDQWRSCISPTGKFIANRGLANPIKKTEVTGYDATVKLIQTLFKPDEWICITNSATHDEVHDKWQPNCAGTFLPVSKWLGGNYFPRDTWEGKPQGAWIRINPMLPDRYDGNESSVAAWRHVLVEFDDKPKEEQLDIINRSKLPIAAVIDSGGRSVHAWVKVDAANKEQWCERRDAVYQYMADYSPCAANKNASRFSRLAGIMRGDVEQKLIALNIGSLNWEAFEEHLATKDLIEPKKPSQLMDYDTKQDPNNLIGNRWLSKGGSLTIVGQSGVGKSSFAMQLGITMALGKSFFGVRPVRPLRVAFVQAENDMGDMAEAFQGVMDGMKFGNDEMQLLDQNVRFYDEQVKTGTEFIKLARSIIVKHRADILIADPLLSYAGDDISEQAFMSRFLRNELNPVLSETGCVWVWLHHMPKPPRGDQSAGTISDLAYAGAGSADLTNWSREVAVLKREEGDGTPTFTFTLTKRGKRAGMVDNDGEPSKSIRLSHGDSGIVWEYATKKMFVANREQANKKQPKILKP